MTDTSPEALERVADGLDEAGTAFHQDAVSALRALAAEKRAAADGITDAVLDAACKAYDGFDEHDSVTRGQMREALESVALELQSKDAQRFQWMMANCRIARLPAGNKPHVTVRVFLNDTDMLVPGNRNGVGVATLDKAIDAAMESSREA